MKIIVNGTNIFIDMHSIGLLEVMCELQYEIHTVDFVASEIINPEQKEVFLFDEMVSAGILAPRVGAEKLSALVKLNTRLPRSEITSRIEKWESL